MIFLTFSFDTEVGHGKVVVVWFCIGISCFTCGRKIEESHDIATVAPCF